ncbi:coiled-coil domain-containing protein 34 [Pseudophryne corroboree]|uniref:coiled-coil domain-containing protein 34 n=1 Tax=Pseudophryne corroboree TaxID=495146 RepID=UPI0030821F9F
MSSSTTNARSSEGRHSHSTPQKDIEAEAVMVRSKSCEVSSTRGSTYSSLSPICHDSYRSDFEDQVLHSNALVDESETRKPWGHSKGQNSMPIEQSLADLKLSPWEMWLLCKERQGRIELQKKISEELKQEEERRKQQQKKEQKKRLAEEQHKDWVRKKQDQERKEKEHKLLLELQEKEFEERRKHSLQEKSKEKYEEWLSKKKEEELERKRKEKEEEEKREAEQREKKEKADQMFKEWLEQAKNKPRPTLNSYGYVSGKLTGYYDGTSYPAPEFYNPIPWKPIHVPPPPKEAVRNQPGKKKKRAVSSQPYRSSMATLYKPKDNLQVGGGKFKR